MLSIAGKDATAAYEDIGHSEDAREILSQLLVGTLPASEQRSERVVFKSKPVQALPQTQPKGTQESIVERFAHKDNLIKVLTAISVISFGGHFRHKFPRVHLLDSGSSFWNGVALSTATSIAIVTALTIWFNKTLTIHKDFTKYPPHRKFTSRIASKKDTHIVTGILNPRNYQSFPLTKKYKLSHNVYRFVFGLPHESDILGLPVGQHISIRATIDGKVISRSYTPTSGNSNLGEMQLTIKTYPNGKISNYLANLSIGDQVEIRGPKGAMKYHKKLSKHMGMIAGGTGITPMFSIIRAVCDDTTDDTTVSLIYANQTEDDILVREELDDYARKCPDKFSVHYVLSKPPEGWKGDGGRVSRDMIEEKLPKVEEGNKFLVCGPEGMEEAMKGHLLDMGCEKPSNITRYSDQLFLFS